MRFFRAVLAILIAPWLSHGAEPGFVSDKPIEGRCVQVDGGFLTPYEVVIPGSEVSFWMEPIVGGTAKLTDPGSGETIDVELGPYWIGRCEVTWAEYQQYMNLCAVFERFDDAGVRPVTDANRVDAITAPSKLYDPGFTFDSGDDPDLPAVSMTQYAAKQYTKWLSLLTGNFYRLPSEAEWEHACRAGGESAFAFGDDESDIDAHAWHEDNSDWATHPVGGKKPNAWRLHDMHGNACEWVLDAHDAEPLVDPDGPGGEPPVRWPTKLFPRVLKGGSAFLTAADAAIAERRPSDDNTWRDYDPNVPKSPWWFAYDDAQDVGFRLVRPLHVPDRAQRTRYWDADLPRIQKVADFRIDEEGRGERGVVDPGLPHAIKELTP